MGQIHQLILEHGIDEAKARTLDKLDRQCVETAFAVMSDEEQRVGMTHAGFAMTALPHKAVRDTIWIRQGGGVKLKIESGLGTDDQHVGLPYVLNRTVDFPLPPNRGRQYTLKRGGTR